MTFLSTYLLPPLPEGLEGLAELALDLRWSTSHAADAVWERIDPERWALTRNPWLILQTISTDYLKTLAADAGFQALVKDHVEAYRAAMKAPTWFQQAYPASNFTTAYFCMEFGLSEALPIYSGGLGILAGDHLKTVSDLGVPLVGVGLLYQQGYFRQAIDATGAQIEYYPFNDPSQLSIVPARDASGEWVTVDVSFPGRLVRLRAWKATVGRAILYLLDSNLPINSPADRGITSELYGGGSELRLQQEIALGIGGWRLLRKVGVTPEVCHLNEGHAALAVLERARTFMIENDQPFDVALAATRAGNIFTTHTPVPAGFDRFSPVMVGQYLGPYANDLGIGLDGLLALGRQKPDDAGEPLNMAYLAIRGSGAVNAVSRLHGQVSRRLFRPLFPRWPQREIPITHVTNGVHVPTWESALADDLWEGACGKGRWSGELEHIEAALRQLPAEALWAFRSAGRQQLIGYARERFARQLEARGASQAEIRQAGQILDPNALTLGFARRFATYKRPTLLLHDPDRLIRLLSDTERPVQLIIAGKAHPHDQPGKELVQAWFEFMRRPDVPPRIVFLADYDITLAHQMVQGIDVWINNPRRPMEASGTSGMKVLVNGGLNLSELDGWWAEAYAPDVGWALGDGQEHDDDPGWDAYEAEQLYNLLEQEVIRTFYDRDARGVPQAWVARMRESMAMLTARFSTNRMVREYVEHLYLPAAKAFQDRKADRARKAVRLCQWHESLQKRWSQLHFGTLAVQEENGQHSFKVPVYFGELEPDAVQVQLYAEPQAADEAEIHPMIRGEALKGAVSGYLYSAIIPAERPADDYTPRVIPTFDGAEVPLESQQILWYR
jgi:starch phosphorylase